jgi:hypothetical protein
MAYEEFADSRFSVPRPPIAPKRPSFNLARHSRNRKDE